MRLACLLLILAVLAPLHARSGPTAEPVLMEDLTWTELRDRVHGGTTTILIPIGGTEQNGPHMVLGKHNIRVKALASRIADRLGNALVAPVVAYVPEGGVEPPQAHMRFPGTITIPDEVFARMLESAARSFRAHGFRDIVLLGDHGGYQAILRATADRLTHEWAGRVRVHAVPEYYRASQEEFAHVLRGRGFSEAEIGVHAGLGDTALMLAIEPAAVRMNRLHQDPPSGPTDGVRGDPRRASADLGRMGIDLIVSKTVDAIRSAVAQH